MPNVLQTHFSSFLPISKLKIFKQTFPKKIVYFWAHIQKEK
jgi:hypothetical protein